MARIDSFMHIDKIVQGLPYNCLADNHHEVYQTKLVGKSLYIYGDHANSAAVWLAIARENPVNLLVFDNHADADFPFRAYRNGVLNHNDAELIPMLQQMKLHKADLEPRDIFQVGKYIKRSSDLYSCSSQLRHNEQNHFGVYMGLLREAYICSPDQLGYMPTERWEGPEELRESHSRLHMLDKCFLPPNWIVGIAKDYLPHELNHLAEFASSNMGDDIMQRVFEAGFDALQDYVLDIDLDFFRFPFWRTSIPCFGSLFQRVVSNARAISIATEPMYVKEAAERFSYAFSNAALDGVGAASAFSGKIWTSAECLHWLLRELENMLYCSPA